MVVQELCQFLAQAFVALAFVTEHVALKIF